MNCSPAAPRLRARQLRRSSGRSARPILLRPPAEARPAARAGDDLPQGDGQRRHAPVPVGRGDERRPAPLPRGSLGAGTPDRAGWTDVALGEAAAGARGAARHGDCAAARRAHRRAAGRLAGSPAATQSGCSPIRGGAGAGGPAHAAGTGRRRSGQPARGGALLRARRPPGQRRSCASGTTASGFTPGWGTHWCRCALCRTRAKSSSIWSSTRADDSF